MQELKISNAIKIVEFNSEDYISNNKNIYDYLENISKDYKNSEFKDYLDNINGDIFLQNKKLFIYVLFEGEEPLSFAIFSKISNAFVTLDAVYTAYGYVKLGFATILLRACAVMLKTASVNELVFKNDDENLAYMSLLNSFQKVEGVVTKQVNNQTKCNITDMDANAILLQIKELAIM